jgi:hypothetical protein
MTKLERLNTWHDVTLRHSNGQRCTITPMWGCNSFMVSMYYKGRRMPFYGRSVLWAVEALKYANGLGYK